MVLLQVIYVSRNPKDVVVSFYHFHKMANFLPEVNTFPEFVNQFLEGTRELMSRQKIILLCCEDVLTTTLQPKV